MAEDIEAGNRNRPCGRKGATYRMKATTTPLITTARSLKIAIAVKLILHGTIRNDDF